MIPAVKDYTIINQLKQDFETKFNSDNSRVNLLDVKIGTWSWDNMELKPSIAINPHMTSTVEKLMGNKYIRRCDIDIDIFCNYNYDIDNDWQDIYKLREQIESFLKSTDNTYRGGMELGDEQAIYIGDATDPVAISRIVIGIKYQDNK